MKNHGNYLQNHGERWRWRAPKLWGMGCIAWNSSERGPTKYGEHMEKFTSDWGRITKEKDLVSGLDAPDDHKTETEQLKRLR